MPDSPVRPRGSEPSAAQGGASSFTNYAADLRSIIMGTGVNFLGSIFRTVFLFFYAVFIATFLDPASVGLFFLGVTVMTIFGTASTLALDVGVLRYTALYDGEGDRARVSGVIAGATFIVTPVSIIAGVLLFFFARPLAEDVFGKPDFTNLLRVFAAAVPLFSLAKVFNAGTQGLRRMRYQVYSRDVAEQLAKFLLSAVLLLDGLALAEVVSANVAALALATCLSFYFLHKVQPVYGIHVKRIYEQRRLLKYSMPLAVSTILSLLLAWTDTLFLGYYRSSEEVGIYSIAMRLAIVGAVIMFSFNTMFAPLASDFYNRGEQERLVRLLKSVTKWVTALGVPVFALLAIFSAQALRIMGTHYTAGATALSILAVAQLVDAASGPVAMLLMMCGRPRVILFNNVILFFLDVLFCTLLIPRYGIVGAALAYIITISLFNMGAYIGVFALLKLQPFSAGYAKVLAAGAIASGLAVALKVTLPFPWNDIVAFFTFIGSYIALAIWKAFDASDLEVVESFRQGLQKAGISRS